jgi:hypothetical protein
MDADGAGVFGQLKPSLDHLLFQVFVIEQSAHHRGIGVGDIIVSTSDRKKLTDVEPSSEIEKEVNKKAPSKMRLDPVKEDEVVGKRILPIVEMIAGKFQFY